MLVSSSLLSFLVVHSVLVSALVRPTTPGPNETYTAGATCKVAWDVDASRLWTNMTIDLMSGPNNNMTRVVNVAAEVDGTNASLSPFSWSCPEVTPYSGIYFYQFSNPSGNGTADFAWTTRFTIASPAGEIESPPNATQPNGDPIPWGIGYLKEAAPSSPATPSEAEAEESSPTASNTLGKGSEFETATVSSFLTPSVLTNSDSGAQRPMIAGDSAGRKHTATTAAVEGHTASVSYGTIDYGDGPESQPESTRTRNDKEKHTKTAKVAEEEMQAARASAVLENAPGRVDGSGLHGQADASPACRCYSAENGAHAIGRGGAVTSLLLLTSIVTASVLMTA